MVKFPPSSDLPQHAAQIRLLDELLGLAPCFAKGEGDLAINKLAPGTLIYGLMWLLARFVPMLALGKITLWLVLLLTIAVLFFVAAARQRPPQQALLACIFIFNAGLYWGFINFLFGFPLFLLFVHFVAELPTHNRSSGRTLYLSVLLLALYGAHALWFAAGAAWLVADSVVQRVRPTDALVRFAALIPSAVLATAWYPTLAADRTEAGFDVAAHWFVNPLARLGPRNLVESVLGALRGPIEPAILLLVIVWIVLALWTNRQRLAGAIDFHLASVSGMLWIVALFGPDKYMNTILFAARFAPAAMILLLLALPAPRFRSSVSWLLPCALAVFFFAVTTIAWLVFDKRDLAGLDEALHAINRPARVVALDFVKSSPVLNGRPYLQLGAYAQVLNGSMINFSFAEHGSGIVIYAHPRRITWTIGLEWLAERVRPEDLAQFD